MRSVRSNLFDLKVRLSFYLKTLIESAIERVRELKSFKLCQLKCFPQRYALKLSYCTKNNFLNPVGSWSWVTSRNLTTDIRLEACHTSPAG